MKPSPHLNLSRRERQIMDAVYARGQATVAEVQEDLPDPPSYSAVRAMLGKLERKGYLRHEEHGLRYVYVPTLAREAVQETALDRLLQTFFDGSA
ncbi:MAG TPA: BlaI/MecI/CopY family transcriptional regulator, partial [Longimicrobiales bacterium]|nr:BlaI/MecI/CopY family transcriptional regulator [Longimicrobiales bacterium]